MDISRVYGRPRLVTKESKLVRGLPPSAGSFKLNVDGSALTNPGKAGFGGLIRDEDGSCIAGLHLSSMTSRLLYPEISLSPCAILIMRGIIVRIFFQSIELDKRRAWFCFRPPFGIGRGFVS